MDNNFLEDYDLYKEKLYDKLKEKYKKTPKKNKINNKEFDSIYDNYFIFLWKKIYIDKKIRNYDDFEKIAILLLENKNKIIGKKYKEERILRKKEIKIKMIILFISLVFFNFTVSKIANDLAMNFIAFN